LEKPKDNNNSNSDL